MNTDKLTEGLEIKNYRELCKAMEWKPVGGDTKVKHLKELESICKYHKYGYKFIIEEIYKTPLPIVDNRGGRPTSIISEFCIDEDKFNNGGVYIIQLDDEIYIGSTVNFRQRFNTHRSKSNTKLPQTRDLIERGGQMSILHDMTDIEDEELLRMVEYEYIKYFRDSGKFTMLNGKIDPISFDKYYNLNKEVKKQKYVKFKVKEEDWEEVALLLKERGIEIC